MFPFNVINTYSHEMAMSIQPGAASAIYWAIVFAATSLACLVMYESLVDRGDGRPAGPTGSSERHTEDRPLKHAA